MDWIIRRHGKKQRFAGTTLEEVADRPICLALTDSATIERDWSSEKTGLVTKALASCYAVESLPETVKIFSPA